MGVKPRARSLVVSHPVVALALGQRVHVVLAHAHVVTVVLQAAHQALVEHVAGVMVVDRLLLLLLVLFLGRLRLCAL